MKYTNCGAGPSTTRSSINPHRVTWADYSEVVPDGGGPTARAGAVSPTSTSELNSLPVVTGERTPMTASGRSSDDEISLREHMQRQLDVIRETALVRFSLERDHTHDSIAATKEHLERIISDLQVRLDERFGVAMTGIRDRATEEDKRYEQRFQGQEQAVSLALARVDKEFHEHIASVRTETTAALDAADKAIHKSEVAIEKRFDGVNEFRQQLADQAGTFMPRKESDVRMDSITEKIDRNADQLVALQLQVTSRLDLTQGQTTGSRLTTSNLYAAIGALGAVLAIIIILANQFLNKTP